MDTIVGTRLDDKCVLSLHFVRTHFQIYLLLEEKTQAEVKRAFDYLEEVFKERFSDFFSIILTDRESEFLDYKFLETSKNGKRRSTIYYLRPCASRTKGSM